MVYYKKDSGGYIGPRMEIYKKELGEGEIQEEDDGADDEEESVGELFADLLDHG
jgi:hypothetical protein